MKLYQNFLTFLMPLALLFTSTGTWAIDSDADGLTDSFVDNFFSGTIQPPRVISGDFNWMVGDYRGRAAMAPDLLLDSQSRIMINYLSSSVFGFRHAVQKFTVVVL